MSEKKVPKPTHTNLFALGKCVEAAPGGIIEKVDSTYVQHLRRCLAAGLLESAGKPGAWKLSAAGIEALKPRS
jgi:hypothetical protein